MSADNKKIFDIEKTIASMAIREKARLTAGASFFGSAGIERLNIPRLQLLDGGTGINFEQLFGDMLEDREMESTNEMVGEGSLVRVIEYFFETERLSEEDLPLYNDINKRLCKLVANNIKSCRNKGGNTEQVFYENEKLLYSPGCYPPGIVLGATWNPEVVLRAGQALGLDAIAYGVHILLGSPNVNIHRDPLNGRLFEGYSEDPFLVSALAPRLVEGVQEYGVVANVKHFAANNQETFRTGINEHISKRALEEIYFPGFFACVDAGVRSVMSAYNKINGIPCTENYDLLTDKLKCEWGFDGMVISDWGAVQNLPEAIKAGNDLAMPGPMDYMPIVSAVDENSLDESALDRAVERILKTINWIADNRKEINVSVDELMSFTNEAAYAAAAEGIVLLENNGVLPLKEDVNVSIMGSPSYDNCGALRPVSKIIECGNGSAGINTDRVGDLAGSISCYTPDENISVGEVRENTEIMLYAVKIPGMEGNDKKTLRMSDNDRLAINALCGKKKGFGVEKKFVLILNTSGPVELTGINEKKIDGILAIFLPGMEGCHALADILFGKISPSGKLPLTFPARYEDTPTYINFPGDGYNVNYGEGIYVGYRYYDKKKLAPKYHFGYGLTYTTFLCRLDKVYVKDNNIHAEVSIKNTGKFKASQVVQIYVGDVFSTVSRPVKELKAFQKVLLDTGEEQSISFNIGIKELAYFDMDFDRWIVEEGFYDVYAAVSSAECDIFGRERVYIDVKSPYSYGINSTIKTLYEHKELKQALYELWKRYGFEEGILGSNYQYTASNRLKDIIPSDDDKLIKEFEEKFMEKIEHIKKF